MARITKLTVDGTTYDVGEEQVVSSVNGSTAVGKSIYAPVSYGTSGQVLKSNGSGGAPTWADMSSSSSGSNPNILINPDFSINQRGLETYSSTTNKYVYCADRWRVYYSSFDSTTKTLTSSSSYKFFLSQFIENYEQYKGKQITLSAKFTAVSGQVALAVGYGSTFWSSTITAEGTYTYTCAIPDNASTIQLMIGLFALAENTSVTVDYIKAEVGDTATPYTPPNPAEELAKCQRYYRVATAGYGCTNSGGTYAYIRYPIPVTMRTTPTATLESSIIVYANNSMTTGPNAVSVIDYADCIEIYSILSSIQTGKTAVCATGAVFFDAEF